MLRFLDGSNGEADSDQSETFDEASKRGETDAVPAETLDDMVVDTESDSTETAEPVIQPTDETEQITILKQKISGLERRIGYLERIVKVSQILNSTLSLEPLLQIIIQSATELTNTEDCSILLIDKNTGELRFAQTGGGTREALKDVTVPMDDSIAGWVIRKDRPLLIRDAKNDPRWHQGVDETLDFETHSILGVPLKLRDKTIGVLEVVNKKGETSFNEDDIQIATTLSAQAAIAVGGEYGTLSEIAFALKQGLPVAGLGTWQFSRDAGSTDAIFRASSPVEAVDWVFGQLKGQARGRQHHSPSTG